MFKKLLTEQTAGYTFSLIAAGLMTIGYLVYIGMYLVGDVMPNATTWCLWGLGGGIEAWTFQRIVRANKKKKEQEQSSKQEAVALKSGSFWLQLKSWFVEHSLELTLLVCFVFAAIVALIGICSAILSYFGTASLTTAFTAPEDWELMIAAGDILVVLVYTGLRVWMGDHVAAKTATVLMLADVFLSFLPIWSSTLLQPFLENPIPWFIWTLSYALLAMAALFETEHQKGHRVWLLVYPISSCVFHGLVGVFALMPH